MYSVLVQKDHPKTNTLTIVFSGELLIDNAEAIYAEVKSVLGDYDSYVLSTDNVGDIDLSFIQLILALEKELKQKKKNVEKNIQIPETLTELFTNTGFETIKA
jgi:ABC-type transporter Mla MlaB component